MRNLIKLIILLGLLLILMVAAGSFVLSNSGLASPRESIISGSISGGAIQVESHSWPNPKVALRRAPAGIKIK